MIQGCFAEDFQMAAYASASPESERSWHCAAFANSLFFFHDFSFSTATKRYDVVCYKLWYVLHILLCLQYIDSARRFEKIKKGLFDFKLSKLCSQGFG